MAKQSVYTVVDGPLDHDGKRYANGDFVELDPKVGDRLAESAIVAKGRVDAPAPQGGEGDEEQA
jgi:hypothetical protein